MWPQLESICVPISHPRAVTPVSHPKYSRPAKRRTHYLVVRDASNGRQQLREAADMAGGHGEVDGPYQLTIAAMLPPLAISQWRVGLSRVK
jgi:hypothetical protein